MFCITDGHALREYLQTMALVRIRSVQLNHIQGKQGEIHELARYEVRPEALAEVLGDP